MLANADKALALDPGLSEAHAARGDALSILGHDEEAKEAFEKAMSARSQQFRDQFPLCPFLQSDPAISSERRTSIFDRSN